MRGLYAVGVTAPGMPRELRRHHRPAAGSLQVDGGSRGCHQHRTTDREPPVTDEGCQPCAWRARKLERGSAPFSRPHPHRKRPRLVPPCHRVVTANHVGGTVGKLPISFRRPTSQPFYLDFLARTTVARTTVFRTRDPHLGNVPGSALQAAETGFHDSQHGLCGVCGVLQSKVGWQNVGSRPVEAVIPGATDRLLAALARVEAEVPVRSCRHRRRSPHARVWPMF
jgi:hypothetical protein